MRTVHSRSQPGVELTAFHQRRTGAVPAMFRAPGRVNLLGEHTDYSDGFCMPAALDLYNRIAISARTDHEFRLFSLDLDEVVVKRVAEPVPQKDVLRRFGMLNLCARRAGLTGSVTRYVYFGAMPRELEQKFAATAQVHAALLDATRRGCNSGQCFQAAADAYRACGYPGQEMDHHQGGATGYLEREWLARPKGEEVPQPPQAFAWNPSITGAKTEETVLLRDSEIEAMTLCDALPQIDTEVGGRLYRSTGVLVR